MIALTWRQHRLQLIVGGALLAAIACYLVVGAVQHDSYADSIGLFSCIASNRGSSCGALAMAFFQHFGPLPNVFGLLVIIPLLGGLFWGAPLVAREVETGTHRLAWTQSVTRRHWLTVKLAAFLAATVLGAVIVSLSFGAWMGVAQRLTYLGEVSVNRLAAPEFDLTGIVPVGTALFAFALGTAAGALIRRTIPAMAVTLGVYLAVTLPVMSWRYSWLPSFTLSGPFGGSLPMQAGADALSTGYSDAAGHPLNFSQMLMVCGQPDGGNIPAACFDAHGFRFTQTYLPGSDYWPLQFTEAGAMTVLAAALLAVAIWRTTRRIS